MPALYSACFDESHGFLAWLRNPWGRLDLQPLPYLLSVLSALYLGSSGILGIQTTNSIAVGGVLCYNFGRQSLDYG